MRSPTRTFRLRIVLVHLMYPAKLSISLTDKPNLAHPANEDVGAIWKMAGGIHSQQSTLRNFNRSPSSTFGSLQALGPEYYVGHL